MFIIRGHLGVDTVAEMTTEDRIQNEYGINGVSAALPYEFPIWFEGTTAVISLGEGHALRIADIEPQHLSEVLSHRIEFI